MKKILVFLLAIAIMATTCVCVFAEEPDAEAVPVYPCMVTGNKVRERMEPNTDSKVVCKHNKGDIVNVVDPNPDEDWWQLDNGHYMSAKYLELMCSNDSPYATDVEETEDWLVRDEEDESVGNLPRLLGFTDAPIGTKKEDVVAYVHNCVLLITRERCIECYQNDQLTLRIDLELSGQYMKFAVSETGKEPYQVDYIYEITQLIMQHSTDYSYFVVID